MLGTRHLPGVIIGIVIALGTSITYVDQSNFSSLRDAADLCENSGPKAAQYLTDLRAGALEVRKALCLESGSQDEVFRAFMDFLINNRTEWFSPYGRLQKVLIRWMW